MSYCGHTDPRGQLLAMRDAAACCPQMPMSEYFKALDQREQDRVVNPPYEPYICGTLSRHRAWVEEEKKKKEAEKKAPMVGLVAKHKRVQLKKKHKERVHKLLFLKRKLTN